MNILRQKVGGYTIIEVMIVLAVSAALFATSIIAYSSQNRRTQFTESVQTFAQTTQDVLNDIDTGFYATDQSFSCTAGSGQPVIDPNTSSNQGSNSDCIFLGKAIQFAPSDSHQAYDVFTIVGRRVKSGTDDIVSSLNEAQPKIIKEDVDKKQLSGGVEIKSVKDIDGNALSLLAIVADSGTANVSTNSGFNTRSILAGVNGSLYQSEDNFLASLDDPTQIHNLGGRVDICLSEGGTNGRTAIVSIGGTNQGKLTIETKIDKPC